MYICICNGITERDIRTAVAEGASTLDCLRDQLGVAAGCGTCACIAESFLEGGGEFATPGNTNPTSRPGADLAAAETSRHGQPA